MKAGIDAVANFSKVVDSTNKMPVFGSCFGDESALEALAIDRLFSGASATNATQRFISTK